jgi:hypothetical protein
MIHLMPQNCNTTRQHYIIQDYNYIAHAFFPIVLNHITNLSILVMVHFWQWPWFKGIDTIK